MFSTVLIILCLTARGCHLTGVTRMLDEGKPQQRVLTAQEKDLLTRLQVNYENCGISADLDDEDDMESHMHSKRLVNEGKYNTSEPHTVVTHGFEVRPGQTPWQVSMQMKSEGMLNLKIFKLPRLPAKICAVIETGNHICGGTIVSACHVMTAAHCVYADEAFSLKPKEMRIVYGSTSNLLEEDESVKSKDVKRVIKNSNFKKVEYDVAIVQVKGKFEFDETTQPACLPMEDTCAFTGSATITGFGLTNEEGKTGTNRLKGGVVTIIPKTECQRTLHTSHYDPKTMLCQAASPTGGTFCM